MFGFTSASSQQSGQPSGIPLLEALSSAPPGEGAPQFASFQQAPVKRLAVFLEPFLIGFSEYGKPFIYLCCYAVH